MNQLNEEELSLIHQVRLKHRLTCFVLGMEGGNSPLSLKTGSRVLIDRNIISELNKNSNNQNQDTQAKKFWLNLLNRQDIYLDPCLYAAEGNKRRTPIFDEFENEYRECVESINKKLPKASILFRSEDQIKALYQVIENNRSVYESNVLFLKAVAPLILQRCAKEDLTKKKENILNIAKKKGVKQSSLVLLIALSCLYESENGKKQFSRKIINPKESYSDEDAHNTIQDIRGLEFLVLCNYFFEGRYFFVTQDKSLAGIWNLIQPNSVEIGNDSQIQFNFQSNELFPRLLDEEIPQFQESLNRIDDLRF